MDKEQKAINTEIKAILADHAKHLEIANCEMGAVKETLAGMKKDLEWITKGVWIILAAMLTGIVVAVFNVILK